MKRMIFRNIRQLLTMDQTRGTGGILGLVERAALVVEDGCFGWVGPEADLPAELVMGAELRDVGSRVVMPGVVECHTHLVHAGQRASEFELRCQGVSYEEIARRGGGIVSTVRATRKASRKELVESSLARLDDFLAFGVTTLEVKSGYGLDLVSEIKILEVVRLLAERHVVRLVPTFLGAHVVPPEFRSDRSRYVDMVCREMIPEVASRGLARFCDVFCELGAFNVGESRRILEAGLAAGLVPKIHAEQLTRSGGALLAAEVGAASADHLDHAEEEDAEAMASCGVVAVFLPCATFFLGKQKYANGLAFVRAGAEIAVSTDYNPGSSNTRNPWLAATTACTQCGLTPSYALRAITAGAAAALRLEDKAGTISPGRKADFIILNCSSWEEILYNFGGNPVAETWVGGAPTPTRVA